MAKKTKSWMSELSDQDWKYLIDLVDGYEEFCGKKLWWCIR